MLKVDPAITVRYYKADGEILRPKSYTHHDYKLYRFSGYRVAIKRYTHASEKLRDFVLAILRFLIFFFFFL